MRRPTLLLLVLVALAAGSCAESDLRLSVDESRTRPSRTDDRPSGDPDDVVAAALQELEGYWSDTLDDVYGVDFEPLRGGYLPYGPDTPLPPCGDEPLTYEIIAENALYCPSGDFIAWDRVGLVPHLQQRFGPLTVGLVMAHEFAHAIQDRAGLAGTTVTLELQADCFAGTWVQDVDDRVELFATDGDALDQAVAGLLELRDSPGMSGRDPVAHGSGFDRVSAFQDGFENGPETCAAYTADPPSVVAIPFGGVIDQATGGNMPLDELLPLLQKDLESFFTELLAEQGRTWEAVDGFEAFDPADGPIRCGRAEVAGEALELASFFCASDDTAYMDGAELIPELEAIGDFAFGGELARLYAFAAQEQLGIDTDDVVREGLHADCTTGVYTAAQFLGEVPDQELQLSPGDVDEIIIAFLAFGGESEASAFERTAAFRAGFVQGFEACESFLD